MTADPVVQARQVPTFFDSHHAHLSTLGGQTNETTSQPPHATNAGSRLHAEALSTLRATVMPAIPLKPQHANRLKPDASRMTKAPRAVPTEKLQAFQPEFDSACTLDEPAKAHRRSAWASFREAGVQFSRAESSLCCGAFSNRPSSDRHRPGKPPWRWAGWIGFASAR